MPKNAFLPLREGGVLPCKTILVVYFSIKEIKPYD